MTADSNPKHAAGRAKPAMRHIPPSALLHLGRVMDLGAAKYGPFNWGESGVAASVYYDAALRHLFAWYTGEEIDPESGQPHLAHVMACMSIVLDAQDKGVLVDDRPTGKTTAIDAAFLAAFGPANGLPMCVADDGSALADKMARDMARLEAEVMALGDTRFQPGEVITWNDPRLTPIEQTELKKLLVGDEMPLWLRALGVVGVRRRKAAE